MPQAAEQYRDDDLSAAVVRVRDDGERVKVRIGGVDVVLISPDDLEFLEDVENKLDLLSALESLQEAVKEKKFIPWADIVKEMDSDSQANGS